MLIARDVRKHKDTRKIKIRNKAKQINMKHDYLRSLKTQSNNKFNLDDLVLSDSEESEQDDEEFEKT